MLSKYLSHILINHCINKWAQRFLLLIQVIQIVFISINFTQATLISKALYLLFLSKISVLIIFLSVQLFLVLLFIAGYFINRQTNLKSKQRHKFYFILIIKVLNIALLTFKNIFLLPYLYNIVTCFSSFKTSQIVLASLSFLLYLLFTFPLSIFTYWNKFVAKKDSISYLSPINLSSQIYVYFHIFIISHVLKPALVPYLNCLCSIIAMIVIYFNSPIHFKKSKIMDYLHFIIIANFMVSFINTVLNGQANTAGEFVLYIVSILCIAYLISYLHQTFIRHAFFFNIRRKSQTCLNLVNKDYFSAYMHHIINYNQYFNDILIFLIQHQSACEDVFCFGKSIFDRIKKGQNCQGIFSQIKQFFIKQIQSQYHPKDFETLGQSEIQKIIHQKGKLYLLISQLMLMKDEKFIIKENLRKTYSFVKHHQQLVKKTKNQYGFMTKIEISAIVQIIEEQISLQVKRKALTGNFDLKAYQYFEFQQRFELFKKEISKLCNLNEGFWKELLYKQSDSLKIKNIITQHHNISLNLEKTFRKMMRKYKNVSIIMYEMVNCFSKLVLNQKISSIFNPFNTLFSKFKEDQTNFQKQKLQFSNSSFEVTSDTSVCMVSVDKTDYGAILWQNQSFRKQFSFIFGQIKSQKQLHINALIIPFFRQSHNSYLQEFSINENLMYNHLSTIIYKKEQKSEYIEKIDLIIQCFPSVKDGLKIIIFFKKLNSSKDKQQKILLIDQKFQNSLFSKSLLKQWNSIIMQSNQSQQSGLLPLQSMLKQNEGWKRLIQSSQKPNNIQIKLDMDESDYKAKLIKTLKNEKGIRYFIFQVFNILTTPQQPNLFTQTIKNNSQGSNCLKAFMQNTSQNFGMATKDLLQKQGIQSKYLASSNYPSARQQNNMLMTAQFKRMIEEKNDQQIKLERTYHIMSKSQTPNKIIIWRIVVGILLFMIMIAMISNVYISIKRKQIYTQNITKVKHYNQMIQYIARAVITVKQYNYQAYTNVKSQKLPYYKIQLQEYQSKISFLLRELTNQLTDTWLAFNFQQNGMFGTAQQNQYVVIANYLLSAITYLSNQPPSSLAFPFLETQFLWFFGMTKSQANFLETTWNGMFVCLFNMLNKRNLIAEKVQKQILSIVNQMYIFPTVIGSSLLFIFMVFSLCVQKKSCSLTQKSEKLLGSISITIKKQKLANIQKFKKVHNKFGQISYKQIEITQQKQGSQLINQTKSMNTKMQESQVISDNLDNCINTQTQRDFNINEQNINLTKKSSNHQQSAVSCFKQNNLTQNIEQDFNSNVKLIGNKKITLIFYLVLIIPFLTYFISIFFGGYYLNNKIMSYIKFGSQLYHISTHQQYQYLYTRETFLFQGGFDMSYKWGQILIPGILSIYESYHFVQRQYENIDQTSIFAQIKNKLDHGNLCDNLNLIPSESIYYGISFDKKECQSIANHMMMQGLKPTFTYYVDTAVQLVNQNKMPQFLPRAKRIQYLEGKQLKNMKSILAYTQQFFAALNQAFQTSMVNNIDYYINLVIITSSIMIVSLILIIRAINYRWQKMQTESKLVQSILKLISFKDIQKNKRISEEFMKFDYKFYE